jgi:hypothetical protein
VISDLKKFWKELDQEYFQEVDINQAVETIEEMIKRVNSSHIDSQHFIPSHTKRVEYKWRQDRDRRSPDGE